MKRNFAIRTLSLILALAAAFSLFTFNASAAETVSPRMNNGADVDLGFGITSNGLAAVSCAVDGTPGITQGFTVEVQIQRKGLLWWSDVDGGYWLESYSGYSDMFSDSIQLEKTGKYRAVFTVTVSGTGGADDVIEDTLTYEYE